MIRYEFDQDLVEAEIAKIDKKWLEKAADRTEKLIVQGFYEEKSPIWSVVKPVYMKLQNNKCIFCERQFEGEQYGKIEHDLEHFRPKGKVDAWPVAANAVPRYEFSTGDKFENGYYWLAYHLHNYAAACKVCNSTFKQAFFPIAASRAGNAVIGQNLATPTDLESEKPLLCYPLGEIDDDPEDIITFRGTIAVPVHTSGHKHARAKVIIDFFGLNEREQLHIERARMISLFGAAFEKQKDGSPTELDLELIQKATAPDVPHSACLKAFARSWATDEQLARKTYEECRRLAIKRRCG